MSDQEIEIIFKDDDSNTNGLNSSSRISKSDQSRSSTESDSSVESEESNTQRTKIVIKGLHKEEICDLALQLEDKYQKLKIYNGPDESE